jgi:light-regulated signal transduction histidine kinase (bacteriophytochrome)
MTPPKGAAQTAKRDIPARGDLRARRYTRKSVATLDLEAERLSARVEELKRENAALEAFAAAAAHELVEPLIVAEAYASMVSERLDEPDHADSRRDLAALGRTASRARLLIEALLYDARATDQETTVATVDLDSVVAGCLETLASEIAARHAKLTVGKLPTVVGSEPLLHGLFSNLLLNGLKYSRRQEPELTVEASRERRAWEISVTSEGPIIPVEDRERIFEPYQRGRGERRARGAGLGLTICRRIVERHGGEIGVVPATGGGNRFFFTLPS